MTSHHVSMAFAALALVAAAAAGAQQQEPDPAAVQRGGAIFRGKGMCYACHGAEAKGTALAPNLTDSVWLHLAQPSPAAIDSLIRRGVPKPKQHPAAMPPMGGAALTESEVRDVAHFVFFLSARAGNKPRS